MNANKILWCFGVTEDIVLFSFLAGNETILKSSDRRITARSLIPMVVFVL